MRSKRPFVIVTRKLPDPIETRMMELFACRLNLDDRPLGKPELIAAVAQAEVLVPTVTDRIDAEVLAAAGPALKLIASFGTGIDHVDLAAAQQRGIIVTNTPGVLTEDTADMTMALILAVSRRTGARGASVAASSSSSRGRVIVADIMLPSLGWLDCGNASMSPRAGRF